jgi:hypothetical protein
MEYSSRRAKETLPKAFGRWVRIDRHLVRAVRADTCLSPGTDKMLSSLLFAGSARGPRCSYL